MYGKVEGDHCQSSCHGGPIVPVLILLLVCVMSNGCFKYSMETYNGKKRGLVTKIIDCEYVSFPKDADGLKTYATLLYNEILQGGNEDIAFGMIRIAALLAKYGPRRKGRIFSSNGLNVTGKLASKVPALINFKICQFTDSIEKLRETEAKEVFARNEEKYSVEKVGNKDNKEDDKDDDESDWESDSDPDEHSSTPILQSVGQRHKNFALNKNGLTQYPGSGPHTPLLTNTTITFNSKVKKEIILSETFVNYPYSNLYRAQSYNTNIKSVSAHVQDIMGGGKKTVFFNTHKIAASLTTESVILNVENLKINTEKFFKESFAASKILKDANIVVNRIEVTTKSIFGIDDVNLIDQYHQINVNLIQDLLVIMIEKLIAYNWKEIVKISEISLRAIKGKYENVVDSLGKLTICDRDYFQDLQTAIQSIRTTIQYFWNGRFYLRNNNRFCPSFDLVTGRIVFCPFNNAFTSGLLISGNDLYQTLLEELKFGNEEAIVMYKMQDFKECFKNPLDLMTVKPPKEVSRSYVTCPNCHDIFDRKKYRLNHPCVVAEPLQCVALDSALHMNYLMEAKSSLSKDQLTFAELILFEKKNGLLLCPGGAGKTYLLRYIAIVLETQRGKGALLKVSMTVNSANENDGKSLHALFGLKAEPYEIWCLINERSEENVEFFCKTHITKERCSELCDASVLLLDEVK